MTSTFAPFTKRTVGRLVTNGKHPFAWMDMNIQHNTQPKPTAAPGSRLLGAASLLLVGLALAQGYVSWRAQYAFIDAAKHAVLPSTLEALGLDAGAVIFALLGLAHARMGRPAKIERVLNLACAFGSMTMNLLGADLGSPRSVAVYVLPAVLYAACSDRLIATAGHAAGVTETSVWRWAGVTVLYLMRACVAFPSTAIGMRRWLLLKTPLPGDQLQQGGTPVVMGMSKRTRLLALYENHPDYGDRGKVSRVASELAPQADLQPGTARSYLLAAVKAIPASQNGAA